MTWQLPLSDSYFGPILERTPEGFEIDHLDEALKYCKQFRVAVDGGAHIGTWSVHMAKRFKQVFAFEPAPDTYVCLVENVNKFPNIHVCNAALGSQQCMGTVVEDPTRQGNTGSRYIDLTKKPERVGSNGHTSVTTVDGFAWTFKGELDFLKLDVEGFEIEALKGATNVIEHDRPVIMVECKEFDPIRNGGVQVVRRFLQDLGYIEVGGLRNDKVWCPK